MGYGEFWSGHGLTGRTVSYCLEQGSIKLFPGSTLLFLWWRIHICSFRNRLESVNNQTSVQDNHNFPELGGPLHKVYIEGGSSRCVVESSLLTTFLPVQS